MNKVDSKRNIAVIVFVMTMIFGIRGIVSCVRYSTSEYVNIIYNILIIGLGITLFKQKKNYVLLSIMGIITLIEVSGLIKYFTTMNLLFTITYLILFVLFLFNVVPALKENAKKMPSIAYYLPAILMLLLYVYSWIECGYFSILEYVWRMMCVDLIRICMWFFIAVWLNENINESKTIVIENPEVKNSYNVTEKTSVLAIGNADKLKEYKELLDCGILTEEEFMEKKKELLGL